MKKIILSAICLLLATAFIGCGTIKGLGEDITAVGGWLTRASEKTQTAPTK